MRVTRERLRRLMQLAGIQTPRRLESVLTHLPRHVFSGTLTSALRVRLGGAALCTAGLAFIGFGTLGAPVSKGGIALTAATCATGSECVHATQVPTTGDNAGCTDIAGLLSAALDPTDSYWHFVIPSSQGYSFNGTTFTATFTGGSTETTTFVQGSGGSFKGVVVEADGGATLQNAVVLESGITGETTEAEGTGAENSDAGGDFQLSSSCATPATVTTSSQTTTKTITAPGTTVTTTITGPTTTITSPTTTTNATTVTNATTEKTTETVPTTVTVTTTTVSGRTVTETTTVPTTVVTTQTVAGEGITKTVTNSTTVTVPTTVTVSSAAPGSSSSSSSTTPAAGVLPATTSTPATGADLEFGIGLVLLVSGGGLLAFATRISRRK